IRHFGSPIETVSVLPRRARGFLKRLGLAALRLGGLRRAARRRLLHRLVNLRFLLLSLQKTFAGGGDAIQVAVARGGAAGVGECERLGKRRSTVGGGLAGIGAQQRSSGAPQRPLAAFGA